MTGYFLRTLGVSLGLTLASELGFALLCRKRGRALLVAALANLLTNPPAATAALAWRWSGLPAYPAAVLLMELAVVLLEGFFYQKSREFPRPYRFSLCANALSFGLGLLLNHLL